MIEAKTDAELEKIRKEIELAHEWAHKHFRTDLENETRIVDEHLNMIPAHAHIEFPQLDTMYVDVFVLGNRRGGIIFQYKLMFWKDGGLSWNALNPLTMQEMPPLIVRESQNLNNYAAGFALRQVPNISIQQAYNIGSAFRRWQK